MQTETAAAVDQVDPAAVEVLTERQKEIKAIDYYRGSPHLSPGEALLITVDREQLSLAAAGKDGYPFRVFKRTPGGSISYYCAAKSVEMHGPSWLVAFPTTLIYCGESHQNAAALETMSPITYKY